MMNSGAPTAGRRNVSNRGGRAMGNSVGFEASVSSLQHPARPLKTGN
jgi:hypothetical protein